MVIEAQRIVMEAPRMCFQRAYPQVRVPLFQLVGLSSLDWLDLLNICPRLCCRTSARHLDSRSRSKIIVILEFLVRFIGTIGVFARFYS